MPKAKDVDPLKLKRERAGRYVTASGRFAVEGESTGSWYVIDQERENELGLPFMAGPFATLEDARAEITAASERKAEPAPMPTAARRATKRGATADVGEPRRDNPHDLRILPDPEPEPEPEPELKQEEGPRKAAPARRTRAAAKKADEAHAAAGADPTAPTWLSRLAPADQKEARRLLALLERMGIEDPTLARREVEGNVPEIARTILARRARGDALDAWQDADGIAAEVRALPKRVRRHLRAQVDAMVETASPLLKQSAGTDELAAFAWLVAVATAAGVFATLESEGRTPPAPGQPGWRLVELDARGEPTGRPITIDESDLLEP